MDKKIGGGETMTIECCCSTESNIMIIACSGGSNVGQITNQVAVELTKERWGKMFCLAGIGAHLSGFVQSAKDTPVVIVIDGCEIGCAKEIFKHLDIPIKNYFVVTKDLKIEKTVDIEPKSKDIERLKQLIKEKIRG